MASKNVSKAHKLRRPAKDTLPNRLPLAHARRATKQGMIAGYLVALHDVYSSIIGRGILAQLEQRNVQLTAELKQQIGDVFREEFTTSETIRQQRREMLEESHKNIEEMISLSPTMIDELIAFARDSSQNRSDIFNAVHGLVGRKVKKGSLAFTIKSLIQKNNYKSKEDYPKIVEQTFSVTYPNNKLSPYHPNNRRKLSRHRTLVRATLKYHAPHILPGKKRNSQ